ncbi:MAG: putative porin [Candidatus Omnitrophota bacterium]|nr:putative porin [Candidatus Omnitrophota bacterium]
MKRNNRSFKLLAGFLGLCVVFPGATFADDAAIMTMVKDLQTQVMGMKKTIDWQSDKIKALESGKAEMPEPAGNFKDNLKAAIGPADTWLEGIDFSGDFRVRYEGQQEKHDSATNDRNRFRYRLRFGWEKEFSDEMKVGFRLVSAPGESANPTITSTNTTFDTNFAFKDIAIDRVFATYTPKWALYKFTGDFGIKKVEVTAGKFNNPFTNATTQMIWDGDVTPEGIYEKVDVGLYKSDDLSTDFSILFGQLVLEEGSGSNHDDAELFAIQGGFTSQIDAGMEKPIGMKNFMSWYDYKDFGLPGNFAATGGNPVGVLPTPPTILAAQDFDIVEFYNEISFTPPGGILPKSKLFFDWAWNTNGAEYAASADGQNDAWGLGLKIGSAKKKGQWEAGYEYYNIEANSVPGVFVDSDFGGADRRGSIVKAAYALTDYLTLGVAAFMTDRVSADAFTADEERRLYQVDLAYKW